MTCDSELSECDDLDLETLAVMLDEAEAEERPDCKASTSSGPSLAHELGLVLSDEDEEESQPPESNSSFSSFSDAFSQSKLSKKQTGMQNNGPEVVDPLEAQLREMQARVKLLQDTLAKKKRLDVNPSTKFSKLTTTPDKEKKATSRVLSAKEESELRERLKTGSELHAGDTDSEDEEDNRNPMEQRYNSHGQDIKQRIAHESKHQRNEGTGKGLTNMRSTVNKPGWKDKQGSLVQIGRNGSTSSQDTDGNVTLDQYSGIRIV